MLAKTSKNVDMEASERKEGRTRKSITHPASKRAERSLRVKPLSDRGERAV